MRLFIAMNFPEELRTHWLAQTAGLRGIAPNARWAPTAQMHLTLAFLGEQPESLVGSLLAAIDGITTTSSRLSLAMQGVGAFPNWRRARVVWLGVEQAPALMALAESVVRACRDLGMELEDRRFHPHITLGRLDERVHPRVIRDLERAASAITERTVAEVDSVDLMASTLGAGPAKHELLHRAVLR
jgi:2'-5' RNA ligase